MGEEVGAEKKEDGHNEEQRKKEEEEEDDDDDDDEKKKALRVEEIVLKVDMHCEACARKVVRALKGFPGVEEVKADYKASKVVVVVKAVTRVDPTKVCQRIHKKSGRKVELISPLPEPEPPLSSSSDNLQNQKQQQEPPKQPNQNTQPPAATTVVLKVQMHCEACAQGLKKGIGKIKGVESVATDIASNQVTVKSVLDPDKLVNDVYKKTHKHALIVKNEEKKEEKKDKEEKKEEEKQDDKKQLGEQGKEEDGKVDNKKTEYWPPKHYTEYAYAPQMFSDENPNACSVM